MKKMLLVVTMLGLLAACSLKKTDVAQNRADMQSAEQEFSSLRQFASTGDVDRAEMAAAKLMPLLKFDSTLTDSAEVAELVRNAHFVRANVGVDSLVKHKVKNGDQATAIAARFEQDFSKSGRPNTRLSTKATESLIGWVYISQAQHVTHNGFALEKHPRGAKVVVPKRLARQPAKKTGTKLATRRTVR